MRSLALALITVVAWGCGSAGQPVRAPVHAPRPPPRPASEIGIYRRPRLQPVRTVPGAEAQGLATMGGLRARMVDDRVEVADQWFASEIDQAIQTEQGWVFLTREGTIATSREFLGPIEVLGVMDESWHRAPARGRLIALNERRELLTTTGAAPLAPMDGLQGGGISTAVFATADRGAAIRVDGSCLQTVDAGERWVPVSLGERVASELHLWDGQIIVRTYRGDLLLLGADGSLSPAPPSPESLGRGTPEIIEQLAPYWSAVFARHPELAETLESALIMEDGSVLWVTEGRVMRTHAGETEELASLRGEHCRPHRWGAGAAVFCRGGDGYTLHRVTEDWRVEEVHGHGVRGWPALFLEDGRRVVWANTACADQEDSRRSPGTACLYDTETGTGTEVPDPSWQGILTSDGDRLLDTTSSGSETIGVWRNIHTGAITPLTARAGSEEIFPRLRRLRVTADRIVVLSWYPPLRREEDIRHEEEDEESEQPHPPAPTVMVGRVGEPLREIGVPEEAETVAFARRDFGVAVDSGLSTVWVTRDLGESWAPHEIEPALVRGMETRHRERREVTCNPIACEVEHVLVVRMGAGAGGMVDVPAAESGQRGPGAVEIHCDPAGASDGSDRVLRAAPTHADATQMLVTATAVARLSRTGRRVAFEWSGQDEQGTYAELSPARTVPRLGEDEGWVRTTFELVGATRKLLLLRECIEFSCQILVVGRRRVTTLGGSVLMTLPLPGGGIALLVRDRLGPVARLVSLGSDGTVEREQRIPFTRGASVTLAKIGRQVSVAYAMDDAVFATRLTGGQDRLVSIGTLSTLRGAAAYCSTPPSDAEVVLYAPEELMHLAGYGDVDGGRLMVERHAEGLCVRGLEQWRSLPVTLEREGDDAHRDYHGMSGVPYEGQGMSGVHVEATEDGVLAGQADDGELKHEVVCEWD